MRHILQVRHLTTQISIERKTYTIVNDLSFDLKRGKTLALLGESGSGKSMTALSLLRLLPNPPALSPQGEVIYKGNNLLSLRESEMRQIRGSQISMIFQNPMSALNPVYTIGEQLRETAAVHLELDPKAIHNRILQVLEDVKLPNPQRLMREYPHQLSGGMLQRAMIAMALICSPDVLIADEPTTALDVTIQSQILSLLKELQQKRNMALLLITHDIGVVSEIADDVIVMYAGEQIEQACIDEFFNNPAHPYTQALFAACPNVPKERLSTIPGSAPQFNALPIGCPFHSRCHYAMHLCKKKRVPIFFLPKRLSTDEVSSKGEDHLVRCWLYDKNLEQKIVHEEAFNS